MCYLFNPSENELLIKEHIKVLNWVIKDEDEELASYIAEKELTNIEICLPQTPRIFHGNLPIQYFVCYFGAVKCYDILVNFGFTFECNLTDYYRTCSHYACAGGSIDILRRIETSYEIYKIADEYGNTPIHYAAMFGNINVFQYLFSKNIETTYINHRDLYPIHYAAQNGFIDIVRFIIDNTEFKMMTPSRAGLLMKIACRGQHINIILYLIGFFKDDKYRKDFFNSILYINNLELFLKLWDGKALTQEQKETIVREGNVQVLKFLMKKKLLKKPKNSEILASEKHDIINEFADKKPLKYAIFLSDMHQKRFDDILLRLIKKYKFKQAHAETIFYKTNLLSKIDSQDANEILNILAQRNIIFATNCFDQTHIDSWKRINGFTQPSLNFIEALDKRGINFDYRPSLLSGNINFTSEESAKYFADRYKDDKEFVEQLMERETISETLALAFDLPVCRATEGMLKQHDGRILSRKYFDRLPEEDRNRLVVRCKSLNLGNKPTNPDLVYEGKPLLEWAIQERAFDFFNSLMKRGASLLTPASNGDPVVFMYLSGVPMKFKRPVVAIVKKNEEIGEAVNKDGLTAISFC